jgi:hypothetical protein
MAGLRSFYARELRRALGRPARALAFVLAVAMHAVGHAATALAAAAVALVVARGAANAGGEHK